MSGGLNYTSRQSATSATASTPQGTKSSNSRTARPSRSSTSTGRHALQVARDITIARQVRPLVAWTQTEKLRRLAYALRPLIDRGLEAQDIAAELTSWWLDWRPARPAAFIAAELGRRAEREATVGHAGAGPSVAFSRAVADLRVPGAEEGGSVALVDADGPSDGVEGLTRDEVIELRSAAAADPGLVLAALENLGERDVRRLYTNQLVDAVLLREFGGAQLAMHG
ncbi:hypothetical protein [Streptomyces flavovirens]|uniref:hypothetical protein n=1 Tax=Streptomyces flavovirens TaxID=52258 RepID=UPI0031EEDBF0